jgi:hypothetical protein
MPKIMAWRRVVGFRFVILDFEFEIVLWSGTSYLELGA